MGGMNADNEVRGPAVADMPVLEGVTHSFVDLPGLRMHVAEAGDGDPVVLLHGAPQNWWEWHAILPELATTHRVIAPDLRGAGWTDVPSSGYRRESLLADLVNLLDAMQLARIHLVAHDWSALLGYQLCLRHPGRVRSYVCISVPHPYARIRPWMLGTQGIRLEATMLSGLGGRSLASREQRVLRSMFHDFSVDSDYWTEERMNPFATPFRDARRARAITSLYRGFIGPEGVRVMFGKYRSTYLATPTRVLIGEQDEQIPPEMLVGHEAHAADLTIERVEHAGHWLPEERPDAVIATARELCAIT